MAKEKNSSKWISWLRLAIAVLVIVAGVLIYFVRTEVQAVDTKVEAKTKSNEDAIKGSLKAITHIREEAAADVKDLEIEGCKPSTKNKFDIALVQKDIKFIKDEQKAIRTEQTAGFKEILERLPKKPE